MYKQNSTTTTTLEPWRNGMTQQSMTGRVESQRERVWRCHAHDDGVYGVDMNAQLVVSAGDDNMVNVYQRFYHKA